MVAEFWQLGENLQDRILASGYEQETVDGIAVDIHDLLQAADLIRDSLAPGVIASENLADLRAAVDRLKFEIDHMEWHCRSAKSYLQALEAHLVDKA